MFISSFIVLIAMSHKTRPYSMFHIGIMCNVLQIAQSVIGLDAVNMIRFMADRARADKRSGDELVNVKALLTLKANTQIASPVIHGTQNPASVFAIHLTKFRNHVARMAGNGFPFQQIDEPHASILPLASIPQVGCLC